MRTTCLPEGTVILCENQLKAAEELRPGDFWINASGATTTIIDVDNTQPDSDVLVLVLGGHGYPFFLCAHGEYWFRVGNSAVISARKLRPDKVKDGLYFYRNPKNWSFGNGLTENVAEDTDFNTLSVLGLNQYSNAALTQWLFRYFEESEYASNRRAFKIDSGALAQNRALGFAAGCFGLRVENAGQKGEFWLERGGAACWPSKLLSGVFQASPDTVKAVINEFYGTGVFETSSLITESLLNYVYLLGRPCEGYVMSNLTPVDLIRPGLYKRRVIQITTDRDDFVPTLWAQV